VLAGAAEAFSAGADLKDAASWQLAEKTDVQRRHRFYAGVRLCKAWEEMPQITIAARDPTVLDEAAADIHARTAVRPLTVRCDCAKPAEVDALMAGIVGALDSLDVLVNSVGAARGGRFLDLGEAD
jgi:NAD(P)-dependent dehydrogenase (short-subunit alcohol dehydrogenase family)